MKECLACENMVALVRRVTVALLCGVMLALWAWEGFYKVFETPLMGFDNL